MGATEAISILLQLLGSATQALAQANVVSQLIQTSQAAGNRDFTTDEWATITGVDNTAKNTLESALGVSDDSLPAATTSPVSF